MRKNPVSTRYAKALFNLACESRSEIDLEKQFKELTLFLEKHRFIKDFLENPIVSSGKKQDMAEKLWGITYSGLLYDFAKLLIEKRRFTILFRVYEEYVDLLKEKQKIIDVHVETAMRLQKETKDRVKEVLSNYLKRTVVLKEKVNPGILAGIRITIGNEIMDFSAAGQLKDIKKNLQTV